MAETLKTAHQKFSEACFRKMKRKERAGWFGWDDPNEEWTLKLKLKEHFRREWTQKNLVDIANFCMFLWNLKKEEMGTLNSDDD